MSLLRFFRGLPQGPWREWRECVHRAIVYDVSRCTLEDVKLDADIAALETFGRPTEVDLKRRYFAFAPLGLVAHLDETKQVLAFSCVFSAAACIELRNARNFEPCELIMRGGGREYTLTAGAHVSEVVGRLGGLEKDEDFPHEEGSVYTIELGAAYLAFTFDTEDRLTLIDIEPT